MKQKEEEPIVYKVQLLEDLVARQQKTLETATEIIAGKNRLIELCELETEIYKMQNKRLTRSLIICGVILFLSGTLSLIRLLA